MFWKARLSYRCGEISCFRGLELWACVCLSVFCNVVEAFGFYYFFLYFVPLPNSLLAVCDACVLCM